MKKARKKKIAKKDGYFYCKPNKAKSKKDQDKPLRIINFKTGKEKRVRSWSRTFETKDGTTVKIYCKFMNTDTIPTAKRSGAKAMLIIEEVSK